MSIKPGDSFGAYRVTATLGAGGMGEVYRARDSRLDRDVALKVLPDAFIADTDRLARFEREARVLASLNHPHIGHIYGLEEAHGVKALVLELVEGPTLADVIAQQASGSGLRAAPSSGLPLSDALAIARQIAEALEAAHEQGIVHRDLKPANIKVRSDGTVKVLDFGLAKALHPETSDPNVSFSPTVSLTAATRMGTLIGTAPYMSPEQAKGKPVDKRADVWAFGAVLYETLTGKRAFAGDDVSDTLVSVLRDDPDWGALPGDTPAGVAQVLRICLRKDVKSRLRDMSAVRLALDGAFDAVLSPSTAPVVVAPPRIWQRPIPLALAAVALILAGGLSVWAVTRREPAPDVVRFTILPPEGSSLDLQGAAPDLVISPDGTRVVYQSRGEDVHFVVRTMDDLSVVPLRGSEGGAGPFFSPDGRWVGLVDTVTARVLRKVSMAGGPAQTVAESPRAIRGASWGEDDQIVLGTLGGGLLGVSGGGGDPTALTTLEGNEVDHLWPSIIPGRRAAVFVVNDRGGTPLSSGQLAVLELDTRRVTRLGLQGVSPSYVRTGHLLYGAADGSVLAVPFDTASLEVRGSPVPVLEGVMIKTRLSGGGNFSVSGNGRLVYVSGDTPLGGTSTLVWIDRDGRQSSVGAPPRAYYNPRLSPDSTRIAVNLRDEEDDIWVWNIARETLTRLTFQPDGNRTPVWSPDGTRVAFSGGPDTNQSIYWQPADGSGAMEALIENRIPRIMPRAFSPDGRHLLVSEGGIPRDISRIAIGASGAPEALLASAFNEHSPELSPNGRWLAYESDESGRNEIYVRPYPEVTREKIQISTGGGVWPAWSRDGRELFYWVNPNTLMRVSAETGEPFRVGRPERVLEYAIAGLGTSRMYDVSADGRRFLVVKPAEVEKNAPPPVITVVLNWSEELKQRAPTR